MDFLGSLEAVNNFHKKYHNRSLAGAEIHLLHLSHDSVKSGFSFYIA